MITIILPKGTTQFKMATKNRSGEETHYKLKIEDKTCFSIKFMSKSKSKYELITKWNYIPFKGYGVDINVQDWATIYIDDDESFPPKEVRSREIERLLPSANIFIGLDEVTDEYVISIDE